MKKLSLARPWRAIAPAICALSGLAHAEPSAPAVAATASSAAASKSPFARPAVSPRLLANSRAGSASAVVTETGSLQQTTATNVQTGTNSIGGGSFANALGLTTAIQNSGANVLIQNATTVNVQFK